MPLLGPELSLYPGDLLTPEVQSRGREEGWSWWALYTRSRQEKELMRRLLASRAPFYSPIAANRYRSPAGRTRTSYLPLFTNYVFLFGDDSHRLLALTTNCVSRCLPVPDGQQLAEDLSLIHRLLQAGIPVTAETQFEPGTRIRVKSGAMAGLEGVVFRRQGNDRLLVMVNFLQQGASVELADWDVEPV